jgi:hypothetical protein
MPELLQKKKGTKLEVIKIFGRCVPSLKMEDFQAHEKASRRVSSN